MPLTSGIITRAGAIVDVQVGVGPRRRAALRHEGLTIPDPVSVRAIIDTGSNVAAFPTRVFQQLQLAPVGKVLVNTPSTPGDRPHRCDQFDITLYLIADGQSRLVLHARVIAADCWRPEEDEQIEGLIGRDALRSATFQYFGLDRRFQLAFSDAAS